MAEYTKGGTLRSSAVFRNSAGVLANPDSVTCTIEQPNGVEVVGTVVNDSTGNYHCDILLDDSGVWSILWHGVTGTVNAVEEHTLIVLASVF